MKARLIPPENAEAVLRRGSTIGARIALIYRLYGEELRRNSALDFIPSSLRRTGSSIAFLRLRPLSEVLSTWLIDEFQDTNDAQFSYFG